MAKNKRRTKIKPINNFALLFLISIFQTITSVTAALSVDKNGVQIIIAMAIFIAIEWLLSLIHI